MPRGRLIALQSAVSVVLVGIVVVTILSPDSDRSLFGVDLPGTQTVVQAPPSYDPRDTDRVDQRRADNGNRANSDLGFTGEAEAAPPALPEGELPPAGVPPDAPDDREPGAPPDEQYGDTLSRLSETVD